MRHFLNREWRSPKIPFLLGCICSEHGFGWIYYKNPPKAMLTGNAPIDYNRSSMRLNSVERFLPWPRTPHCPSNHVFYHPLNENLFDSKSCSEVSALINTQTPHSTFTPTSLSPQPSLHPVWSGTKPHPHPTLTLLHQPHPNPTLTSTSPQPILIQASTSSS